MSLEVDNNMSTQEQVSAETLDQLFDWLKPEEIEQFYMAYQLWSQRRQLENLQQQMLTLQQRIADNAAQMEQFQPSAIALAALAQLQAYGVEDIELLDRMLERGDEWLDHSLQLLVRCEQLDLIRGDYTQWCEHALEGAYDWIDSIREASDGEPTAEILLPADQQPEVEHGDHVTEDQLLKKLMSDEEEPEQPAAAQPPPSPRITQPLALDTTTAPQDTTIVTPPSPRITQPLALDATAAPQDTTIVTPPSPSTSEEEGGPFTPASPTAPDNAIQSAHSEAEAEAEVSLSSPSTSDVSLQDANTQQVPIVEGDLTPGLQEESYPKDAPVAAPDFHNASSLNTSEDTTEKLPAFNGKTFTKEHHTPIEIETPSAENHVPIEIETPSAENHVPIEIETYNMEGEQRGEEGYSSAQTESAVPATQEQATAVHELAASVADSLEDTETTLLKIPIVTPTPIEARETVHEATLASDRATDGHTPSQDQSEAAIVDTAVDIQQATSTGEIKPEPVSEATEHIDDSTRSSAPEASSSAHNTGMAVTQEEHEEAVPLEVEPQAVEQRLPESPPQQKLKPKKRLGFLRWLWAKISRRT